MNCLCHNLNKVLNRHQSDTVKTLRSRDLRVLKNVSINKRCLLLGCDLRKIVTFRTKHFVRHSRHIRSLGFPLLGGLTVFCFSDNIPLPALSKAWSQPLLSINSSRKRYGLFVFKDTMLSLHSYIEVFFTLLNYY